jgi:NAD-dependent SIR2 family protein deacetylase
MEGNPRTYTQEEIMTAIGRLGAGFGFAQKYDSMSLGRAQDIVRDAVRELILLRQESREWICTKCRIMFPTPRSPLLLCPKCSTILRPAVVVAQAALLDQLQQSQAHALHVEQSLITLLENLDLDEKDPPD